MEAIRRYLSADYKPDQWGEAAHRLPHVNLMGGGVTSSSSYLLLLSFTIL